MSLHSSEATAAASPSAPLTGRAHLFASTSGGFHPMLRGPQVPHAPETDAGAASDDGPLSIDDAANLLAALDEDPEAEEPDAETGDEEPAEDADDETEAADQAAGEDDAPEDDPASEEPAEDDEPEPDGAPAIEAPRFWSAEEKAVFAKASPDVQLLVAAKDAEAEKRVYAAKEEAAAARKDASVIAEFKGVIDQQVQRAQTIFQGKWDGVDWAQWAKDNHQEAFAAKIEFDQEREELSHLQTAAAATEAEEHRQFLIAERAKLVEAGHVLADPAKGVETQKALREYAGGAGYSATDLKWAGARELETLHKAMLWDQLQARAKANPPKPTPAKEPAKVVAKPAGTVRPAAAAPPRKSVIQRKKQEVVGRAMKTGRMDDAVEAWLALEGK